MTETVQPTATPEPLTRNGVMRGIQAALPMAVSVAVYGVVFGVLARQVGLTALENILMNVLVFAGAAQTAALDQWSYPLPIFSMVMTVLLINLRLILLGASLRPWIGSLPAGKAYPLLHFLFDESWAVAINARRKGERDIGFYIGCNLAVGLAWLPAVVIGHIAGGQIGDPAAIGLDFAFTTVFAAMLFGGYRSRFDLLPWAVAGGVASLAWWLLPGTWYVLIGGLSGFAVALWRVNPEAHVTEPVP